MLQQPAEKKKTEDPLFDHEVEEIGAKKKEDQKEVEAQPVEEGIFNFIIFLEQSWVKSKSKFVLEKFNKIKESFNNNNAQGNNTVQIMLLLFIIYLLWQVYTLQSALSK